MCKSRSQQRRRREAYAVDSEEQTLQVLELGRGEAEEASRVVLNRASRTLVPRERICGWRSRVSNVLSSAGGARGRTDRWR